MAAGHTITIELSEQEFAALAARARALGKTLEAFVTDSVRTNASVDQRFDDLEARRRRVRTALDRLSEIVQTLPESDVASIMEESRAELEQRPYGPLD